MTNNISLIRPGLYPIPKCEFQPASKPTANLRYCCACAGKFLGNAYISFDNRAYSISKEKVKPAKVPCEEQTFAKYVEVNIVCDNIGTIK